MSTLPHHLPQSHPVRPLRWLVARSWQLLLGLALLSLTAHAQQRPTLRLDLLTGGPAVDQTYVYFEQGATTGFDANFDATKLPNSSGLNLASFEATGQQLAINGLPPAVLSAPFVVDLFVGVPAYGSYTVQVEQLDDFTAATVYLTDALLGTMLPLALGTTYSFDLTAANTNNTYTTSTRFALLFLPATAPLPVTLTSFTAAAEGRGVRMSWATASEQHSAYFGVERSRDGQTFGEIGRVAAAGTSGQTRTYELLDEQPLVGVAYYRLRQVDQDGSFYYSAVRPVAWQPAEEALRLFPNPAHSATTVLHAAPGARVEVLDALGRVVLIAPADATGKVALLLPTGLTSGVYVVRTGTQMARITIE